MSTNRIKESRVVRGLTQGEASAIVGIHIRSWQSLEGDRRNPSLKLARRMSAVLCKPVDELFPEEPDIARLRERMQQRYDAQCDGGGA